MRIIPHTHTHTHNKASSRVEGCLKCDAGEGNEHIQNTQEVRTLSYVCVYVVS